MRTKSTPNSLGTALLTSLALTSLATGCPAAKEDANKGGDDSSLIVSEPAPGTAPGGGGAAAKGPSARTLLAKSQQQFAVLPEAATSASNPITEEKIALGRQLYFDKRLSKNHDIACQSCHVLDKFGVDGEPTSPGHKGARGERNSPTVYNAGFQLAQFWDGRAETLEAQAKGPVLNPIEMAMPDEAAVLTTLGSIPGYVESFDKAFPGEGISYQNMANAIGAFERKLVTPGPFDKFLAGDLEALDDAQLRGLDLFFTAECVTCHTGVGIGGTMYQKLGNVKAVASADEGRFVITGAEQDKAFFKVPILRNVAKTAPYMHDGSIATLDEMVTFMVEHQTNKGSVSEAERKDLVAFLNALTGEFDAQYIAEPTLPESGPDTPAPNPT